MSAHRLRHTLALGVSTAFLSVLTAPASGQAPSCADVGKYLPLEPALTGYQPGSARSNFVEVSTGHYEWRTFADGIVPPTFQAGSLSGAPQLAPFNSACWATMTPPGAGPGTGVRVELTPQLPVGARLGVNLLAAPKPGDFLCPAATVGESSLCLLPPGAAGVRTSWQGATRPTLEGVVDLVTGVPLVQVTDLELPFDGAVFRLTRTRSALHRVADTVSGPRSELADGSDGWWDWLGEGWMIGENPILLIDGHLPDVLNADTKRTTWLWLDAHHSIPFQQVAHTGPASVTYEAPPRFRARMTHNGVWSGAPEPNEWTQRPTQYEVWLYDGLLHYTFAAIHEDVPQHYVDHRFEQGGMTSFPSGNPDPGDMEVHSYRELPFYRKDFWNQPYTEVSLTFDSYDPRYNKGFGVPTYALCVKIEDQQGHIVENEYCDVRRLPVGGLVQGCGACVEDGLAKGQLKCVRLKTRGVQDPRWTLLYFHRRFRGATPMAEGNVELPDFLGGIDPDQFPELYQLRGYTAIDRIYAFQGGINTSAIGVTGLTIPFSEAPSLDWNPSTDPLTSYNSTRPQGAPALPTDWVHQVRYHYDPDAPGWSHNPPRPPLMVKTTVRTRPAGTTGSGSPAAPAASEAVKTTVYVYDRDADRMAWLRLIFTDADLRRALQARDALGCPNLDENDLARWSGCSSLDDVIPFATLRLEYSSGRTWDESSGIQHPNSTEGTAALVADYLRPDAPQVWYDGGRFGDVNLVVVKGSDGVPRRYRLHHLLVPPDAAVPSWVVPGRDGPFFGSPWLAGAAFDERVPERSILAHPFVWQSMMRGANEEVSNTLATYDAPANMSKSRWITVIDEFRNEPESNPDDASYGENSRKPGQISRRVVSMNPAGYVLKDRRWDFNASGTVVSGGGLGEEYIYQTVAQLFGSQATAAMPDSQRHELLLVQHRSVGWSAADLASSGGGDNEGLVNFNAYKLVDDASVSGGKRVERTGAGIQRGSAASTKWYEGTRLQIEPEVQGGAYVEADITVEFLAPVTDPNGVTAPGSLSGLNVAYLAGLLPDYKATVAITKRELEGDPNSPNQSPREHRAVERSVIGPPRRQRPGGDLFFPVEKEWYDANGNVTFSATGLVRDPFNPGAVSDSLNSLILTYVERVESGFGSGQTRHTVLDASEGNHDTAIAGSQAHVPAWPQGWGRLPATGAANFITSFDYDSQGLCDMYLPTGRRWARRFAWVNKSRLVSEGVATSEEVEGLPEYVVREYTFNDIEAVQGGFKAFSPGEIKDYNSGTPDGAPIGKRRGEFADGFPIDNLSDSNLPSFSPLAMTRLAVDATGRVRSADLLEWMPQVSPPGWHQVGTKQINDLGEVYREMELDGTITRTTRDSLGKDLRKYIGTQDVGWTQTNGLYNLAMVERTEYGSTFRDAWLPTAVRSYTRQPTSQWDLDFYGNPPSSDADGIATTTGYDWRMRPVRVDSFQKGDPALTTTVRESTTLTYLDHMNRPRLVVTFGRGDLSWVNGNSGLDPTLLNTPYTMPGVESFFSTASNAARPLSVSEMVYAIDGGLEERRSYDVAWIGTTGTRPYQAEFHFRGRGGAEVFTQHPGGGALTTDLDEHGRVVKSRTVAPGTIGSGGAYAYELTRTDSVYDKLGNVVDEIHWERAPGGTGDVLGSTNAVRTRTVNWYDPSKRLVATADLGTEQSGGFVYGAASYVRYNPNATPPASPDAPAPTFDAETGAINRATLPDDAILRMYGFDKKGNQTHAVAPNGAITASVYSTVGRLISKTENSSDSNSAMRRKTEYTHDIGRLATLSAYRTADKSQTTKVEYGAAVLDDTFAVVSAHNGLIGKMWLPDKATGVAPASSAAADVQLRYTFQGRVAEREDGRGVIFRYRYDGAGRLASVEVCHREGAAVLAGYPAAMTAWTGNVAGRIGFVEYEYDGAGHLREVITRVSADGTLLTDNRYEYDGRGDLIADWQSYGAAVGSTSPKTTYAWEYRGTGGAGAAETGCLRLSSITYPAQSGLASRVVTLSYGTSGGLEERLSRLSGLVTNIGATKVADFSYTGSGRRASLSLDDGAVWQYFVTGGESTPGMAGLDSFGRVADLGVRSAGNATLYRAEYTYDASGNRRTARLTQAPIGSNAQENLRSQLNSYDRLDRLIGTQVGALAFEGTTPMMPSGGLLRTDAWTLDLLGNWVGGSGTTGPPGRLTNGSINGQSGSPWTKSLTQPVNERNQLTGIQVPETSTNAVVRHDAAGNLVFDGTYLYQFDAWDRLIQVNKATLSVPASEEPLTPSDPAIVVGDLVKQYCYDGLGRLIRTLSPYPEPGTTSGLTRTERFYYDGIRRIQEVVSNPVASIAYADGSNDPFLVWLADQTVEDGQDSAGTPLAFEQAQGDEGLIAPFLEREYVWGPGGVDELLAQFDAARKAWYAVCDDGGDVVALCDTRPANHSEAVVVSQVTYDAYGEPVTVEHFAPHPYLHCGHKGLFVDRLDVGVTSSAGYESPRLVPYGHLICHNRNRVYIPQMGRFLQADPNATAMVLMADSAYHGRGMGAIAAAFSMEEMYGDGGNLYQYLGSNPVLRHDTLGLSWDPFSMPDEYLAEHAGSVSAFMERISSGMKVAAYVGAMVASMLPFPITSTLADFGAGMLEGGMPPELVKMRKILGYVQLASLVAVGAKLVINATQAAAAYLIKYGLRGAFKNMWSAVKSVTRRLFSRKEKLPGACGCFAGSTAVWTIAGLVPIDRIRTGDFVLTRDEQTNALGFRSVTAQIVTKDAALLEIMLRHDSGREETLQTTDEHPFFADCRGWVEADRLSPGESVRTMTGTAIVLALRFLSDRTTVYNLSVNGVHTFQVGPDGVLVHNCEISPQQYEEFVRNTLRGGKEKVRSPSHGAVEFDVVRPGTLGEVKSGEWWKGDVSQIGNQAAIARELGQPFTLYGRLQAPAEWISWLEARGGSFEWFVP